MPRFCTQLRARLQRALFDCRVRVSWARGNFILAVSIVEPSKTLKLAVYELFLAADQTLQLIQKRYWIEAMGSWRRHDNEEWRNSAVGNKSPIMLAKSEGDSDTNPLICSKPKISKSRWPEIAESA